MGYFDLILHAFLTHLRKPLRAPLKLLVSELPLAPARNLGVLRLALLVTGEAVQRSLEIILSHLLPIISLFNIDMIIVIQI